VLIAAHDVVNPCCCCCDRFTTVSLVSVVRMPFTFLPLSIMMLTQSLVALSRIEAFLALPELEDHRETLPHVGVEMQAVELTWGEEDDRDAKDAKDPKDEQGGCGAPPPPRAGRRAEAGSGGGGCGDSGSGGGRVHRTVCS
jgi:hypothetical protein